MALHLADGTRAAMATAINTRIGNSAILEIYSGTQPADGDAAAAGTLLSTHTCNAAGFGTVSSEGVLTASAIGSATASATGTPGWGRLRNADGTTRCLDVAATEMTVSPATTTAGTPVNVTSLVITIGNAT